MRISPTVKGTFSFTLARLGGSLSGAIATIFLARKLGPEQYGLLSIILSLSALFSIFADFGISSSTARYIAEAKNDGRSIFPVFRDGLFFKLFFVVGTVVLVVILAKPIALLYKNLELQGIIKMCSMHVIFATFLLFAGRIFQAIRRLEIYASAILIQGLTILTLVVLFVKRGGGLQQVYSAYIIGTGCGFLFLATVLIWFMRRARKGSDSARYLKTIASYCVPLAALSLSYFAFSHIDNLLLGYFAPKEEVGYYNVTFRIINFLRYPFMAIGMSISPLFAKSATGNDSLLSTFMRVFKYTVVLGLPICASLIILSSVGIRIFLGEAYLSSIKLLSAQTPFFLLSSFIFVFGPILSFAGFAKIQAYIFITCAIIAVGSNIFLIPHFGPMGAVASITIAFTIYTLAILLICKRVYSFGWITLLRNIWRPLLATIFFSSALIWFSKLMHNTILLFVLTGIGFMFYFAIIFITKTVRKEEIMSIIQRK